MSETSELQVVRIMTTVVLQAKASANEIDT
jgi:hypothetical protein